MPDPARTTIRIGTRGSPLARWQAEWVAGRLRAPHPGLTVELVEIRTHGDRDRNSPLAAIGGAGLFTKEIQRALADGAVEVAVHSLKDLPTRGAAGPGAGGRPRSRGGGRRPDRPDAPGVRRPAAGGEGRHGVAPPPGDDPAREARPGRRGHPGERRDAAEQGARRGSWTPSCWPRRGSAGSGWSGTSPTGSRRRRSCRRSGRGRSGSSAGATTRPRSPCSPRSTTPRSRRAVLAERRVLAELEGGCMIPLAAFGRDTEDGRLVLDAAVYDPDGARRSPPRPTGRSTTPTASAAASRRCSASAGPSGSWAGPAGALVCPRGDASRPASAETIRAVTTVRDEDGMTRWRTTWAIPSGIGVAAGSRGAGSRGLDGRAAAPAGDGGARPRPRRGVPPPLPGTARPRPGRHRRARPGGRGAVRQAVPARPGDDPPLARRDARPRQARGGGGVHEHLRPPRGRRGVREAAASR